jgi:hypothetical protein
MEPFMTDSSQHTLEVSLRAYARHRQVALSAVQKAIASGRITKTASGKIEVASADRQWLANTDLGRCAPDSKHFSDWPDDLDDETPPQESVSSDYQRHRAKREEIRATREQIELDILTGASLDLVSAQRIAFTAFRTLRDAVMNVPARTKDLLAAETDASRIEVMLDKELAAALQAIDLKSIMKEQNQDQEETEDGS